MMNVVQLTWIAVAAVSYLTGGFLVWNDHALPFLLSDSEEGRIVAEFGTAQMPALRASFLTSKIAVYLLWPVGVALFVSCAAYRLMSSLLFAREVIK
jgi:hypothetical protein